MAPGRATTILWAAVLWQAAMPVDGSRPVVEPEQAGRALFHTVFPVECKTDYLLWQTVALWYSFKKVGQPGSFTRLLACAEEDRKLYTETGAMDLCPTHVTPSYTHYHKGDSYGPYNMGGTVLHWTRNVDIKEDYILILDSDMIFMRPIMPSDLQLSDGHAVAAFYGYLKGVNNDLAVRQVPEIAPRTDTLAGPVGRRGDQVGGVQIMTTNDLRRVAPRWIEYTEKVREDKGAWADSGDVYVTKGGKPWISEMYGYSFGCAKAGVWHTGNHSIMLYPEYFPTGFPTLMHYGIRFDIGKVYSFDKHWFQGFDILKCPPWDDMFGPRPHAGLLPAPPGVSQLPAEATGMKRLQHLYASYNIALLNEAFCDFHINRCTVTDKMVEMCKVAKELADSLDAEIRVEEEKYRTEGEACEDADERCPMWAKSGECVNNSGFMMDNCRKACAVCKPKGHHGVSAPAAIPSPIHLGATRGQQRGAVSNPSARRAEESQDAFPAQGAPSQVAETIENDFTDSEEDADEASSELAFLVLPLAWIAALVAAAGCLGFRFRCSSRARRKAPSSSSLLG